MGPIQRALGMGSTIEFRGQEYKISPWTYQIQGEFERFMEKRAWEAVRRAAAHMQPDEAREARAALTADIAAGEYSFGSGTVAKACANLPTLEHLIFLLLREDNQGVSPQLVHEMVEADLEALMEKVNEITADPTKAPARPATTEAATPSASTKSAPFSSESLST